MNIDPDKALMWFTLLNGLCTVALGITVWLRKPGEDAGKAVAELREDMTEQNKQLSERLVTVETHMKHMPTSEEVAELEGTVKQIDERTQGLAEAVATIRATLSRIETFLLTTK